MKNGPARAAALRGCHIYHAKKKTPARRPKRLPAVSMARHHRPRRLISPNTRDSGISPTPCESSLPALRARAFLRREALQERPERRRTVPTRHPPTHLCPPIGTSWTRKPIPAGQRQRHHTPIQVRPPSPPSRVDRSVTPTPHTTSTCHHPICAPVTPPPPQAITKRTVVVPTASRHAAAAAPMQLYALNLLHRARHLPAPAVSPPRSRPLSPYTVRPIRLTKVGKSVPIGHQACREQRRGGGSSSSSPSVRETP